MKNLQHDFRLRGAATFGLLACALAAVVGLAGCAPAMVAVGAGHAVLMATDPRSTGAQIDDDTIEIKIAANDTVMKEDHHVTATSYNGLVLLTGEVPTQAASDQVQRIAKAIDRVRSVQNELVVGPPSDLSARADDSFITSKVKARLFDEGSIAPNAVKVVTERKVVYLMGIVTRAQGAKAGEIAATTSGVARVVKVFEFTN
jgi:osmotically-inducible protein OsmY